MLKASHFPSLLVTLKQNMDSINNNKWSNSSENKMADEDGMPHTHTHTYTYTTKWYMKYVQLTNSQDKVWVSWEPLCMALLLLLITNYSTLLKNSTSSTGSTKLFNIFVYVWPVHY